MVTLLLSLLTASSDGDNFPRVVQPILTQHCIKCHQGEKAKAGLNLTSAEAILAGSKGGPVVVPGNPDGSLMVQVLATGHDTHMPPDEQLKQEHIDAIANWVKSLPATAAAPRKEMQVTDQDREHWAFRRIQTVTPPNNSAPHPIDRFLLAELQGKNLAFAPPAQPRTLIRRLSFSIVGLPPTPEQVEAVVAAFQKNSAAAVQQEIDRLLASPHYGERWARHWLDVARFSDADGQDRLDPRPNPDGGGGAYHYRDYVIRSFNEDKPFNRFIMEQVAGDVLAPNDREAKIATAFLRLSHASGAEPPKARFDELDDMVSTVSSAVLALTVGCSRCHDHKTDPIPQRDYYRLLAVFAGTERRSEAVPTPEEKAAADALAESKRRELEALRAQLANLLSEQTEKREDDEIPAPDFVGPPPMSRWARNRLREADKIRSRIQNVEGEQARLATALVASEMASPPKAHLLLRGDPKAPADEVQPGAPIVLSKGDFPSDQPRRLALAKWLTANENPLTARVIVNRVWHYHFGRGLVSTPSNFGTSGDQPTHPDLLDWLADDFMKHGWSVKHLHRQILSSAAYQQSTTTSPEAKQIDPDNRLWSRFPRRRLDAEALRDAILFTSGQLNPVMFGPGARARPGDVALAPEAARSPLAVREGPQQWRRSIYLAVSRNNPSVLLESFDAPPPACPCDKRTNTTVPTQALVLLNAPFMIEQADHLARRVKKEVGSDPAKQIDKLYQICLGRAAASIEIERAIKFLNDPNIRIRPGRPKTDDLGALADLAHVMLNLNEFIYIE
jgi:cytochrome c553